MGMLAQLPGSDGAGDAGFGCQEECELGSLDQSMGGAGLVRQVLKRRNILGGDLGLTQRVGTGHGTPPIPITYPFSDFIPTSATHHLVCRPASFGVPPDKCGLERCLVLEELTTGIAWTGGRVVGERTYPFVVQVESIQPRQLESLGQKVLQPLCECGAKIDRALVDIRSKAKDAETGWHRGAHYPGFDFLVLRSLHCGKDKVFHDYDKWHGKNPATIIHAALERGVLAGWQPEARGRCGSRRAASEKHGA